MHNCLPLQLLDKCALSRRPPSAQVQKVFTNWLPFLGLAAVYLATQLAARLKVVARLIDPATLCSMQLYCQRLFGCQQHPELHQCLPGPSLVSAPSGGPLQLARASIVPTCLPSADAAGTARLTCNAQHIGAPFSRRFSEPFVSIFPAL